MDAVSCSVFVRFIKRDRAFPGRGGVCVSEALSQLSAQSLCCLHIEVKGAASARVEAVNALLHPLCVSAG